MAEVLEALGWNVGLGDRARLLALIAITTLAALAGGQAIVEILDVPALYLQIAVWGLWLGWLGMVFPRNHRRDVAKPHALPYRRAFMREILFGVAVAFSQLLRPALVGIAAGGTGVGELGPVIAISVILVVAGSALIALGVSAIGVARTLFVHEYAPSREVKASGIYRFLRHPLFAGGSMVSLGLAACTGEQAAVWLGVLNVCVVPAYVQLEDRRCCMTLGNAYADYRAAVGGVIPRRRTAISRSALAHHSSGSIDPSTGRSIVTTE